MPASNYTPASLALEAAPQVAGTYVVYITVSAGEGSAVKTISLVVIVNK
jgi:hypothetical protein